MGAIDRPVYIIEDDNNLRRALARLVGTAGYTTECFASGSDFLRDCDVADNARVICDLGLPGMSGIDVFRRLSGIAIHLPFIFITAIEDDGLVKEAKRLGSAFLRKPVDGDALAFQLQPCNFIIEFFR